MKHLLQLFLVALFPLNVFALERPPVLPASAWLLVDFSTGYVLTEHNADQRLAPASLTKLMTAYLVFEKLHAQKIHLNDLVTISSTAAYTRGSRVYLRVGSQVPVEDLIKSMLVRSANDATVALAEHVAGSEPRFVAEMNLRSQAWGLRGTTFINSTGLDVPGHLSTAHDLTRIATAIRRDFPDYYQWLSIRDFMFNHTLLHNSNGLLWQYGSADGMKTGYTRQAGWCLIASAQHAQTRLIATVLGTISDRARVNAARVLLDYGFRNFETRLLQPATEPTADARVWLGDSASVPLGVSQNLYVTLPHDMYSHMRKSVTVQDQLYAPVRYGQRLGILTLRLDDRIYGEYPLVALKEIQTGGLVQRAIDNIQLWMR